MHFAMDYLYQRNRWVARELGPRADRRRSPPPGAQITAAGKDVVVIGGGDTGADCVGNALREGARSIVQLELLSEPPAHRPDDRTPWPQWPLKYRLSYAMEEARELELGEQDYSVATTALRRRRQRRRRRRCTIAQAAPEPPFAPVPGHRARAARPARAAGDGLPAPRAGAARPARRREGPRAATSRPSRPYTTSVDGVFAAGDARRGQSLIVWAINEGRQCARMVDRYLAGRAVAPIATAPDDEGLAGHADADEGPEGPPQHVGPGVGAG